MPVISTDSSVTIQSIPLTPILAYLFPPKAVPTVATSEITGNFWLRELILVNTSVANVTVSVYDNNNIYLFSPLSNIPSGGEVVYQGMRFMPGLTWVASGAGVHGYIYGNPI
jgi:hypothetical protein